VKPWLAHVRTVFPELHVVIDDAVAESDRIAERWGFLDTPALLRQLEASAIAGP
jgi:predicted ester cyclase